MRYRKYSRLDPVIAQGTTVKTQRWQRGLEMLGVGTQSHTKYNQREVCPHYGFQMMAVQGKTDNWKIKRLMLNTIS